MKSKWIYSVFFTAFLLQSNLFSQNKLFIRTFGADPYDDDGKYVIQTQDKGYMVTGWTFNFGAGLYDILITKFDSTGNYIWAKTIGGTDVDEGVYATRSEDGGYVVVGNTKSYGAGSWDVLIIKCDSLWNIEWSKMIVLSPYDDQALSMVQTSNGGYALTGYLRNSDSTTDIFLMKTDSSGNPEWIKQYYGNQGDDLAYSLIQSSDGGYALTGYTGFGSGARDAFIARCDSSGDIRWFKTLGDYLYDRGDEVIQVDNKYIMIGDVENTNDLNWHLFISEFDNSGNHLETRIFYRINYNDIPISISRLDNGKYALTGRTYQILVMDKVLFMLLDSQLDGCMLIPASLPVDVASLSSSHISTNVFSVSPSVYSIVPDIGDAFLDVSLVCELESAEHHKKTSQYFEIYYYSSMFSDKIRIDFSSSSNNPLKIKLYDVKGTPVYEKNYAFTPHVLVLNEKEIKNLNPGTYFLSIYGDNLKCSKRIKVIKP